MPKFLASSVALALSWTFFAATTYGQVNSSAPQPDKTKLGKRVAVAEPASHEPPNKVTFDPDLFAAFTKQDRSALDLKTIGDQILDLRKKITDNPREPRLKMKLAAGLYQIGDYEGTAKELQEVSLLRPQNYQCHLFLGKIFDEVGNHDAGALEFSRALELAPEANDAHLIYAQSLAYYGDISRAINEYRRAISLKPSAQAYAGLAEALVQMHDAVGAVKAARLAVSNEPGSACAHVALTKALVLAGDNQSSLRTARQAVLLNPQSAESHIALGRALYAKGEDKAQAIEEFKQAVTLDPLNAEARNDLGYALYGEGDMAAAIKELQFSLHLNPHLSEARNNLEMAIYGLTGRKRH